MNRLINTFFKIALASLVVGAVLHRLNFSVNEILREIGMSPDWIAAGIEAGTSWVIPNIMLGALVIVPVWLIIHLFRPPRG
jgi:Domain of unknown function (DUF6460)